MSSNGTGSEITIDPAGTGGAVTATIDSSYVTDFKIEVCTRNALSGDVNDCLTSTQFFQFMVVNTCVMINRQTIPT